jgi:hypothetical protein
MVGYPLKSSKNHTWISLKTLQKPCLDVPKNPPKILFRNPCRNREAKIREILEDYIRYFEISITYNRKQKKFGL